MGDRLKFERFLWFHAKVKANTYPHAGILASAFELSRRTAQRDIEFMRDRLGAPLTYDYEHGGYAYTDHSFDLPAHWFSEENIMALALASRLASTIPDEAIKNELCRFVDHVLESYSPLSGRCFQTVAEKVSVKNIEYSKVNPHSFHEITHALFAGRSLRITYHSPHTAMSTIRNIHPLHLIHYMGNWHLIAYCAERRDLRDFALSRVLLIERLSGPIALPERLPTIEQYTKEHFGIMHGTEMVEVVLRFSQIVAQWVSEQVWHPGQRDSIEPDGSLIIRFPVSDLREVKRRILSYGADVKVIEPESLQKEIFREIEKMWRLNKGYDTA